jgi:hypothetical protein
MEGAISPTINKPIIPPYAPTSLILDSSVSKCAFYGTTKGVGWIMALKPPYETIMTPPKKRIVLVKSH